MRAATRHRRTQIGLGMIEVLIAGFVLSVGFMGVAALQTRSVATNNSTMARSAAMLAGYSILEVMRVDKTQALKGAYNKTVTADACPGGGSLAKNQISLLCQQLGEHLGAEKSTSAQVACTPTGDCSVTVQFKEAHPLPGGTAVQQVVAKTML